MFPDVRPLTLPPAPAGAPGNRRLQSGEKLIRSALVRTPALPQPVLLRRGDSLEGWRVLAIRRGRVVLERDGLRFELALPGQH